MEFDLAYPTYKENETEIIEKFDKDFCTFSEGYKVNKWTFGSLIKNEVLQKCGYFDTMPENLTFVSGIESDDVNTLRNKELKSIPISGYGLTPAACLHIYPLLAKEKKRNELITLLQKVYRYEKGEYQKGTRLWEFWVREFVAVGSVDYVKSFLEDFEKKSLEYAKNIFPEATLKNATDMFFPSRENKIIQRMQKNNDFKKELIVSVEDKDVACGSFNYHKTHFSKLFEFDEGGSVVTGCVGFGLNRWLTRYMQDHINEME